MKFRTVKPIPRVIPREILVVDDEASIIDIITMYAEGLNLGIKVYGVSDAASALSIFKKYPCSIMFIDLHLPGGIDGLTLGRIAKQDCPMVILNAITGYSDLFTLEEVRRSCFDDYFPKPFDKVLMQLAILANFGKRERWLYGKMPDDILEVIMQTSNREV